MSKLDLTEQHARERAGFAARVPISISRDDTRDHADHRMLYVLGIATILMLAGIAAGANSSHSALEDPFEGPRVDPFSIMVNAKNLPSQESFNFEDERCLATPIQSMERCHAFHASGD
jgi:hypothetical protein